MHSGHEKELSGHDLKERSKNSLSCSCFARKDFAKALLSQTFRKLLSRSRSGTDRDALDRRKKFFSGSGLFWALKLCILTLKQEKKIGLDIFEPLCACEKAVRMAPAKASRKRHLSHLLSHLLSRMFLCERYAKGLRKKIENRKSFEGRRDRLWSQNKP